MNKNSSLIIRFEILLCLSGYIPNVFGNLEKRVPDVLSDVAPKGGQVFVASVFSEVENIYKLTLNLHSVCLLCGNHVQEASVTHLHDVITWDAQIRYLLL